MDRMNECYAKEACQDAIRWCEDIGMLAFDRPVSSCKHATAYCAEHCYNRKLYDIYQEMTEKDIRNEAYWERLDGSIIASVLRFRSKWRQVKRVRLMTRGEAFSAIQDVRKVENILQHNPSTIWWIPTRSWRNTILRSMVKRLADKYDNVRIMASIDPSNTQDEIDSLVLDGWNTMFFGNDNETPQPNYVKCSKTWEHNDGACARCENGCFKAGQNHVWLKQH